MNSLHDTEIERVIIGGAIARGSVSVDERRLSTLDFYSPRHTQLWSKICELDEEGEPLNPVELHRRCSEEFRGFDLKISEITSLASGHPGTVRPKEIETVRRLAAARRLRNTLHALSERLGEEPDLDKVLTEADEALRNVRRDAELSRGTSKQLFEVLEYDVFPRLDKFVRGEAVKIPFGFPAIDESINGGVGLGELVLMGAKPKSGKSFLMLQIARHHAESGIPTLLVSREMLNFENGFRFLAQNSRYSNSIFRPHLLEGTAEDLKAIGRTFFHLDMHLDDRAKTVAEIRKEAKRLKDSVGLKSVFVDYAQLVKAPVKNRNRSDELEAIYYGLKEMAQDLELAVYCLSQFNRVGIKSDRPTMADFDGSSAAEKAGNLIIIWDVQREYSEHHRGRLGKLWIEAGRNVATDEFNIVFHGQDGLFTVGI